MRRKIALRETLMMQLASRRLHSFQICWSSSLLKG